MPTKGNSATKAAGGKVFADICDFMKSKCDEIKDDNLTVRDTITALNERFGKDSDKLQDTEKTALNVMTLLMPVLDAMVAVRKDEVLIEHDSKINKLQVSVRNVEYTSDSLAQYSRRENLRLSGVAEPEAENETLTDTIIDIAKEVKVQMNASDISDVHRLGKKTPGKNRQIIVRCVSRAVRNQLLVARKELKNSERYKNVYISEDLTQLRFKLFQMIRKLDDVKSAYTRDGKIHCVLKNGGKFIVESPDDLFKLGIDEIDYRRLGLSEL